MKRVNTIILFAAIAGFTAVAVGAMGAHALKPFLSDTQMQSFETGVKYHFYHAIVLLITGILYAQNNDLKLKWASYLTIAGILCFSGSIYLLNTAHIISKSGMKFLGPVTPIGGLLLMGAWILIGLSAFTKK
ncbi:MAG: DUF423 domain-containing protein [Bacteroidia bacterium]